jgi:hypothetical protein
MPVTCDALAARIQEFDDSTAALTEPQPGSKVIKSYDAYYYQPPSYTQGLWRWMVGESRETTKEYLGELVKRLVKLMDDAESFLRKNTNTKWKRTLRPIEGRDRIYIGTPMTAELIGQIADVLAHIDRMTKRLRLVVQHLKETYPEEVMEEGEGAAEGPTEEKPETEKTEGTEGAVIDADSASESGSEAEGATSSSDAVSVFEAWNQMLSEAHAALCEASSTFRL